MLFFLGVFLLLCCPLPWGVCFCFIRRKAGWGNSVLGGFFLTTRAIGIGCLAIGAMRVVQSFPDFSPARSGRMIQVEGFILCRLYLWKLHQKNRTPIFC